MKSVYGKCRVKKESFRLADCSKFDRNVKDSGEVKRKT